MNRSATPEYELFQEGESRKIDPSQKTSVELQKSGKRPPPSEPLIRQPARKVEPQFYNNEVREYPPSSYMVAPQCFSSNTFDSWLFPKRVTLSYLDGTDPGSCFGTNFATGGLLFAPDYCLGHLMPLLDLRAHYFQKNLWAFNVGLGVRYIPNQRSFCDIFGLNMYYDYRQGLLTDYSLLGFGIEVLQKCWEFRANATFPLGHREREKVCHFENYFGDYYFIRKEKEFIFNSFNAEVGYYILNKCSWSIFLGGGPYYWNSRCYQGRGGRIRMRPQYMDYLALDVSVSYDTIYKTVYQAQLILYLPLYEYRRLNCSSCFSDRRIYQPIERVEMMPIGSMTCYESNF